MTAVESIGLTLRFVVDSSKTQQKGGVGGGRRGLLISFLLGIQKLDYKLQNVISRFRLAETDFGDLIW